MKRKIITINKDICDGCGNCVSACSEGALQIVDGKAQLVKEEFCDGFGDCIGECPTGALVIKEQEAKPFDIEATKAFLLQTQGEKAVRRMEEAQKKHEGKEKTPLPCGCPGSMAHTIQKITINSENSPQNVASQLRNWPVQIHLLPIKAPYYQGADLLVAADCCAYVYGGFHAEFVKGHTLAIGCPKLDNPDAYKEKLTAILSENDIRSVSVVYMEVPCCMGIVKLLEDAIRESGKHIPIRKTRISIQGQIISQLNEDYALR
jgi:NAD-dependent dihydropyrimidine dehydrogenase PreA subunit